MGHRPLQIPQQPRERRYNSVSELTDTEWCDLASLDSDRHGHRIGHQQPDRGPGHDGGHANSDKDCGRTAQTASVRRRLAQRQRFHPVPVSYKRSRATE